jgi:arabinogalactan endo-1,4-beta-galactosidase
MRALSTNSKLMTKNPKNGRISFMPQNRTRHLLLFSAALLIGCLAAISRAADRTFIAGGDISVLPTLEKAGGVYRDHGQPGDAIQIMRDHGCNLFRVRLFVDPNPDFKATGGAVQDLAYARAMARRIKAAGGQFLLDIHYSDNWADPGKQVTPRAWKNLDFDALEKKVYDYTVSVLQSFKDDGDLPDMVQVGNEITSGVLWPLGKVLYAPADQEALQWKRFSRLENAGAKAVRSFDTADHKILIVIHIHGGGRTGLPKWFFDKFDRNPVDYDIIGLSFYPAWGDTIEALKQNLVDVIATHDKDVLIAETSYPWRGMHIDGTPGAMEWPTTVAGQKKFVHDLKQVIVNAPGRHGLGFVWWYPEAIPVPGLTIWRQGAEGLFDEKGNALPALDEYKPDEPKAAQP